MGERRGVYRVLVGKPEEKHHLEDPGVEGRIYVYIYTGCPRRNGQNFWRVFLMLNYTDTTRNTYIQS